LPKKEPFPFVPIWGFDDMGMMMARFRMMGRFMNETLRQLGELEGSIF